MAGLFDQQTTSRPRSRTHVTNTPHSILTTRLGHRGYAAAESTGRVAEWPHAVGVCPRETKGEIREMEGHTAPGQEDNSRLWETRQEPG
ncbi:unnamed protein product [Ectocarpus sp. CCAP 1310/34]|nr:unnamed protein product [Ectocarpus sp. CCAP 1310/34]